MRVRWSLVLPASGLILFGVLSYHSLRVNREVFKGRPSRYFWWSSIRLDSDPLNKHPIVPTTTTCKDGIEDCTTWNPVYIWVDSGWAEKALVVFPHDPATPWVKLAEVDGKIAAQPVAASP